MDIQLKKYKMNLDALTHSGKIRNAVNKVKSAEIGDSWVLLGYVDKKEASILMTIDVEGEGAVWSDLLEELKDDKIQYAYAKVEFEDITKLFLIHWIGKKVKENLKECCVPHLNEVRNLIPIYDLLVSKMDILEVQSEVQSSLCRSQTIKVNDTKPRSRANSGSEVEIVQRFIPEESLRSPQFKTTQIRAKVNVKIAIIGRAGVGKTYIYLSYQGGGHALTNPQGVQSSVRADCMSKDVTFENYNFTLEIWDTAGQEKYVEFAPVWTRHAKVVICVYDITDKMSYNEIPNHMQTAKEYADSTAIFYLVGNKVDLEHRREVEKVEAANFATQHNMNFIECSGLTGLNILKLFENITKNVVFVNPDILTFPSTNTPRKVSTRVPQSKPTIQLREKDDTGSEGRQGGCCK